VPPLVEQKKIVERVNQIFNIDKIEKQTDQNSRRADRLRQSILKRLPPADLFHPAGIATPTQPMTCLWLACKPILDKVSIDTFDYESTSHKELFGKLNEARKAVAQGQIALLNQLSLAADAVELDYGITL
jgi:hypothetical protein